MKLIMILMDHICRVYHSKNYSNSCCVLIKIVTKSVTLSDKHYVSFDIGYFAILYVMINPKEEDRKKY